MLSLPDASKRRNFSRYCVGTMLCTNGAPSLCTSAKMNALESTHPTKMTSAPTHGPYSMPAATCTTSPGMNATTICRNCNPKRMRNPTGPAPRTSAMMRSMPPGSNRSWKYGHSKAQMSTMIAKNAMRPANLKMSPFSIACPRTVTSCSAFSCNASRRSSARALSFPVSNLSVIVAGLVVLFLECSEHVLLRSGLLGGGFLGDRRRFRGGL